MKVQLRDYQDTAVGGIRGSFRAGYRAPLLVSPTGSGKTVIFSHIMESAHSKGSTVYLLVHRQELLLQASRHLYELGIPHGRIAPGHSRTRERIQVASVQTLVKRLDKYQPPDMIVIDEGHHAVAGSWRKVKEAYPNALVLGVTATPCRLDGKGLGAHAGGVYDDMILGPTVSELIARGYLTRPVVYAPPNALDLTGVKMSGGDYQAADVANRVDKHTITGSAVEHYRKLCPGLPAIAFCASVKHAQHVAEEFRAAGYRSKCLDGTMTDGERKQAIDDLGAGRMDVLTSCMIVSEGTDIPRVAAAILLRPTMSLSLHLQQVGRVLRPFPGKEESIIIDAVGNTIRLGFPDDPQEWTLDGAPPKKRKKKDEPELEVKIRQCHVCFRCHQPSPECPSCGHVYEVKDRNPKQVDGELKRLTEEDRERIRSERRREVGRAKSLDELVAVAKARNYAQGWVKKMAELRRLPADWKTVKEAWDRPAEEVF